MKLKLLAPLLLSLIAAPAFAHGNHDDEDDDAPVPTTQEAGKDAAKPAKKPEAAQPKPAPKPAAAKDKPAPVEPKKP
ncbi:hypothetical protein [Nevskia sp.]|uniref:hypothetical protein n=1 Tax=Nevskia sp. TaxID=1929292 RepID=UPI0025E310CF|nr:hypothetical protein [Nevskia sp.]